MPSYDVKVPTDIGLESIGEVTTTGSPNFPDRTKWKSNPEPPEPATTVQRVGAAHLDVWEDLKYITFVPGSACQMSQAIAYIRYWSKGNTNKKTPVQTQEQSTAPTDPQQKLKEDVDKTSTAETTNPTPQTTQPSTRTILTVPENRATGRRQPVPTQVPVTKSQPSPKSGKIVSANPSGIVIMGPVSGVVSAPDPTDAVWMFLLNPEELQLSSGPDYNRAETWGVSDPNNSGQPLSWRSNRNRKLSFGKVLLHGYTIGKRVDTLEAGLQQLFMARDGENGSDGPPVLEFVWGRRIFGPCVIQNIQVREKAWDKGILVNAEVSFELEQVPEWTINDGEVDILRPGRQPLVNDPILPRGSYDQSQQRDEETPANRPGGNNPGPNDIRYCQSLDWYRKVANDRIYELEKLKNKPLSVVTQRGGQQGRPISNSDKIIGLWRGTISPRVHYNSSLDTEMNKKIERIQLSSFCNENPSENGYSTALEEANKSTSGLTSKIKNVDNYYTDRAISCLRQFKDIYTQEFSDKKCSSSPYRTPTGKVNGKPVQGPGLF